MQLTKWLNEPIWISKVKVIHWPWSKFTQIQHFQTSFPEKPLSRLKSNFIWSLNGMGGRTYVQMVQVTWPSWPPRLNMVKTWKILLLWNQNAYDFESLYAASSSRVLPGLFKWWPWLDLDLFYSHAKYGPLCFFSGTKRPMTLKLGM